MNINYYTDNGHGWAACKIDTLRDLGIADAISHYSYMRGRTAYLEEDCDFAHLLDAVFVACMLSYFDVLVRS